MELIVPILAAAVRSGTPILYATLGEIVTEKSGVMNLGMEGVMLVGALTGFSVTYHGGSPWAGLVAAFAVGALLCAVHAFLCVTLGANQVVCGLALTLFGTGASSLVGRGLVGETIEGLSAFPLPLLSRVPLLGPVLFCQDAMVYLSFFLVAFLWFFLFHTRPGLHLRAVGESPAAATAAGLSVPAVRWAATLCGGGLAALGGAYLSVVNSHMWVEQMTSGRGWIAVALVIFGIWHPLRSTLGAYLFGGVGALQLRVQAGGTSIPAPLLLMLPYVLTIVVLTGISIKKGKGILLGAPAALGLPFHREERE
ncbi:ABC transporter permease [Aminithiophilus ramosus]|uniref:ABC transporter permease n=2 Tax=Synergistales TaxID=649776 RepID=A0A9Q7AQL5_9BACT|nr:ABC transporter permease [Aminithiophilus ramosus]QTX33032.1 ABC transporter permease [Aminithiophilus ramosus]QVL37207.1 ABC transporter permease [Synergistota bacterium]